MKYLHIREGERQPDTWDGIRTGSESCPRLLPAAEGVRDLSREVEPRRLSLVTPVAGPDEIASVLKTVEAVVSEGWGEVVVNDWGVLSGIAGTEGVGITAGRLLMRLRRGPGTFDLIDGAGDGEGDRTAHTSGDGSRDVLDPETRRYFAWGPLYDSPFLAFLNAKGVDRIELDMPRNWLPIPDPDDFMFSLHCDTRLTTVCAACPWLYNTSSGTWSPIGTCGHPCKAHKEIAMTTPALREPLFLRGRSIFEHVELDIKQLELPDSVDRLIYDRTVAGFP